ncbi:MAG TPA: RidA family protein [Caulobacteraceae bacterium]|jgi:enamine deaminase RidA (YjgF/YER057c/UK114 family)
MTAVEIITREAMRSLIEPYGLAEAVRAGNLLFIAGQTGMDESHQVVAGGLKAQAAQAFRNIRAVLEAAGGRPENLVSLTWYVVEGERSFMEDALDITAAREAVFPGLVTGQTAVRVTGLLTPQMLIEIQAVAAL